MTQMVQGSFGVRGTLHSWTFKSILYGICCWFPFDSIQSTLEWMLPLSLGTLRVFAGTGTQLTAVVGAEKVPTFCSRLLVVSCKDLQTVGHFLIGSTLFRSLACKEGVSVAEEVVGQILLFYSEELSSIFIPTPSPIPRFHSLIWKIYIFERVCIVRISFPNQPSSLGLPWQEVPWKLNPSSVDRCLLPSIYFLTRTPSEKWGILSLPLESLKMTCVFYKIFSLPLYIGFLLLFLVFFLHINIPIIVVIVGVGLVV